MTTVQNNGSSTAGSDSTAVAANATGAGVDDTTNMFLTLLVAQIKNQDPLDPADASEFVNQLTQLTQTQSLQDLVGQGTTFASLMDSMQVLSLGGQVGSELSVRTASVELGSAVVKGSIELASSSATTNLVLTDALGVKHRVSLGAQAAGAVGFAIDPAKLGLAAGSYTLAVETTSGETPGVDIAGQLESVKVSGSAGVVLKVRNVGDVASSAVTAFNGKSGS
jgi:flagellar basal-body rod modification protein FlgD